MRSPKPARAENPLGNTRRSAKAYLYLLPAFAVWRSLWSTPSS